MSYAKLRKATTSLVRAASDAAWKQWGSILSIPSGDHVARAIVDPEALIFSSIVLANQEPRLWRVCHIWAGRGTRLLSVQRMKNIATSFDASIEPRLSEFAHIAVTKGNDMRWRKLAKATERTSSRSDPSATPRITEPPALMLRMRLGFGVGIKADVLSFLIGCAGGSMTIQQIASATSYYGRAVRRAVEELHAADFLEVRATAPASYRIDMRKWLGLLNIDLDDPPVWRPWVAVYSFVVAMSVWIGRVDGTSDAVMASEARDLMAKHVVALDAAGVKEMPASRYPGPNVLEPFSEMLVGYAKFLKTIV